MNVQTLYKTKGILLLEKYCVLFKGIIKVPTNSTYTKFYAETRGLRTYNKQGDGKGH